jgi:[CysO sulfur-carrier protein]-S-L-cysteine hydrolase
MLDYPTDNLQSPAPSYLLLPPGLWEEMRLHVAGGVPEEVCGLVAGIAGRATRVYPITNILRSPVQYRMAPQEQLKAFLAMEDNGLELLAIYHSHPLGPAVPSATDIAESYYPDVVYLIWSPVQDGWQCRGFTIQDASVQEVELKLEKLE